MEIELQPWEKIKPLKREIRERWGVTSKPQYTSWQKVFDQLLQCERQLEAGKFTKKTIDLQQDKPKLGPLCYFFKWGDALGALGIDHTRRQDKTIITLTSLVGSCPDTETTISGFLQFDRSLEVENGVQLVFIKEKFVHERYFTTIRTEFLVVPYVDGKWEDAFSIKIPTHQVERAFERHKGKWWYFINSKNNGFIYGKLEKQSQPTRLPRPIMMYESEKVRNNLTCPRSTVEGGKLAVAFARGDRLSWIDRFDPESRKYDIKKFDLTSKTCCKDLQFFQRNGKTLLAIAEAFKNSVRISICDRSKGVPLKTIKLENAPSFQKIKFGPQGRLALEIDGRCCLWHFSKDEPELKNQKGVTYVVAGKPRVFLWRLKGWPDDTEGRFAIEDGVLKLIGRCGHNGSKVFVYTPKGMQKK